MLRYPFFQRKESSRKENRQAPTEAKIKGFVLTTEQLEALSSHLQELLELQVIPQQCRVRCATNQDTLLVLVEHLLHVEPNVQQLFTATEAAIRENVPKWIQSQSPRFSQARSDISLPFRIYLRIAGHQQPYQSHSFTLDIASPSSASPSIDEIGLNSAQESMSELSSYATEEQAFTLEQISDAEEAIDLPQSQEISTVTEQTIEQLDHSFINPDSSFEEQDQSEYIAETEAINDVVDHSSILERVEAPEEFVENSELVSTAEAELPLRPNVITDEVSELTQAEIDWREAENLDQAIDLSVSEHLLDEAEVDPTEAFVEDVKLEAPLEADVAGTDISEATAIEPVSSSPHLEETKEQGPSETINPLTDETTLLIQNNVAETTVTETAVDLPPLVAENTDIVTAHSFEPAQFEDFTTPTEQIPEQTSQEHTVVILQEPLPETVNAPIESLTEPSDEVPLETTSEPLVEFELTVPEPTESELTAIRPVEPELTESNFIPELTEADSTEPELAEPEFIEAGLLESQLIESQSTAPELPVSQLTEPERVEPESTESQLTEPELAEPKFIEAIEPSTAIITAPPQTSTESDAVLETETPVEQIPLIAHPSVATASRNSELSAPPITLATSTKPPFWKRIPPSALIFAGVVGVFVIGSGTYMLTRPCVIGACEPIEKAQESSKAAIAKIQTTDSALEVVDAYDQLTQSSYLLSTIPAWSPYYETAQGLMTNYENQASLVEQAVKALRQANKAALKSQNPPHPIQQWREIQWLWRDAIAQMQKVPADSPVAGLAQRKLKEYATNLEGINARVVAEQNAQDRVNVARKTAQVAETRAGIANSAEAWQQVYSTWNAAINLLKEIPQGTMASGEAQQLIALYQPKLTDADRKRSEESIAANAYNQATQLAEQARALEARNQWEQAASVWQNAVMKLQQIPENTVYSNQAKSLLSAYITALNQAEANRTRMGAMQSVQPQLDRACSGNPKICTYTPTPQAIRVQITRTYDRVAERTITPSQSGTVDASPAIVNQVSELLRSLASISEQAQVPIELYNADGSKFGTYAPDVSGYVQQ